VTASWDLSRSKTNIKGGELLFPNGSVFLEKVEVEKFTVLVGLVVWDEVT
jgi:hypothetical protein